MIDHSARVLLIEDNPGDARFVREMLAEENRNAFSLECVERLDTGLSRLTRGNIDAVLLDLALPDSRGIETFARTRRQSPDVPIVVLSGLDDETLASQALEQGAQDYLVKGQVSGAALGRAIRQAIGRRKADQVHSRHALVMALANLVSCRNSETGAHLMRLQYYSRCLAQEAADSAAFGGMINARFVEMMEFCAPLHDIGMIGIPDYLHFKTGKLTSSERILMQAHTTIGADSLHDLAGQDDESPAFLQMAIDIARHHHEHYDGSGYPDGLAGSAIPLAARVVAVGDVYDALRSRRVYKPALSHAAAVHRVINSFSGHLDPALLQVFQKCHHTFERIFRELAD
ncbi:MAG TPA: HD domain-containing phosphohydrolase [Gemmataceae bacterium]|nr:HD domain-containing phosphohydrolase [Gemmataceae bacterium]